MFSCALTLMLPGTIIVSALAHLVSCALTSPDVLLRLALTLGCPLSLAPASLDTRVAA